MATAAAASGAEDRVQRHGVFRATVTGAVAAPLFFLLCWIGAFLPVDPATHAYVRLNTDAPISSGAALSEGICWSLAFGAIAGFLLLVIYKALEPLDR